VVILVMLRNPVNFRIRPGAVSEDRQADPQPIEVMCSGVTLKITRTSPGCRNGYLS
jgi:hypothetical protein